jgi:hypothetical protein
VTLLAESLKLASPPYATESVLVPGEGNAREQLPAATAAVQEAPAPSETVTEPVGEPAPGATTDTDQGTVTICPTTEGLALRAATATAVCALST